MKDLNISGNPGQGNTFRETNIERVGTYLHEPTVYYGYTQSRISAYFRRLHEEIESHITTRKVIADLLEYNTKLDGTKCLEEKLNDGGFGKTFISEALRKKEKYAKKATMYECYPSAQEINLLLLGDIKNSFDAYVFPLIRRLADKDTVIQAVQEKVVQPIMQQLNSDGATDEDLHYTSDHIYGMVYYLTGMCHLNWTDYDNV